MTEDNWRTDISQPTKEAAPEERTQLLHYIGEVDQARFTTVMPAPPKRTSSSWKSTTEGTEER